jgi:hypothetical protein
LPVGRSDRGQGLAGHAIDDGACDLWEREDEVDGAEFLDAASYKNVNRWADQLYARPTVKRGRMVNRVQGDPAMQLHERHDASDFETKTQDKVAPAS